MEGSYTREERASFKEVIFNNTVQSMRIVLDALESLKMPLDHSRSEYHVQAISIQPAQLETEQLPDLVVNAIEALYMDGGVRDCLKLARLYQLNDSAEL